VLPRTQARTCPPKRGNSTAGWWNGRSEEPYFGLARRLPNVYLDTAASIAYYGAFEKLVERVGADKLLLGSDFPYRDLGYQLGGVLLSSIGEPEKQAILGGNAARLFRLA
jgi:predicted TIM-barrel fold metal-dependent hydrolase